MHILHAIACCAAFFHFDGKLSLYYINVSRELNQASGLKFGHFYLECKMILLCAYVFNIM